MPAATAQQKTTLTMGCDMRLAAKAIVLAVALTDVSSVAMAQDTTFNVSGTWSLGGTLDGQLSINTTTGILDSGSLTIAGEPYGPVVFNVTSASLADITQGYFGVDAQTNGSDSLVLNFGCGTAACKGLAAGLAGYSGSDLGTQSSVYLVDPASVGPPVLDHLTSGGTVSYAAPEIDPNSAASGLALLVGGLLVLRGRKQLLVAPAAH
jgi:hypothetical protein